MGGCDPAVDQRLDPLQFRHRDRPGAVEVEPQPIKIHQGAGLGDGRIHHLLEGRLQQVGGRVVGLESAATGAVHPGGHQITNSQGSPVDPAAVHEHTAVTAHRLNAHDQTGAIGPIAAEQPPVAHLTAPLAIEGGGIQHQLHRIASPTPGGRCTVHHQRQHAGRLLQGSIAIEGGGLQLAHHLLDRPLHGEVDAHRRGLGPLALGLHRRLEARQIHREAVLLRDLLGEFQGEAIGVVELKGLGSADALRPGGQHLRQQLLAPLQGFEEALLLPHQLGEDRLAPLHQLGIGTGHQGDRRLPHGRQERLVDAQEPSVAHHPPQQAPQDVAAAEIGGHDPIADQLGDGAAVVANHLQGGFALPIEPVVVDPREGRRRFDQGKDQIGFVVVGHPLQDLSHALQPQARVDVARLQRRQGARRVAVGLHEHQVVELDEAAVVLQVDRVIAPLGVEVVVDLRAGAAGAGGARGPEIVGLVHADDPLGVHPHPIAPDGRRLVVLAEDTHHQMPGIEAKHPGAQLPGPRDRLLLEIVPEGEVAQHLEERVVTGGAAHVLDVVGADALLGRGGPGGRPGRLAKEHRLERQHAGDREQHGGVVRHQGTAGHPPVAPLLEEAQERLADLRPRTGPGAVGRGVVCGDGNSHGLERANNTLERA